MAGALHVRLVEVPESLRTPKKTTRRLPLTDPPARPPVGFDMDLSFQEAVDDFLARGIVTPAEWAAMSDAARRRSFTATQLASDTLRERAYTALVSALAAGDTYADFARAIASEEQTLGVTPSDPAYIQNIFRTNTAQAYAAGRYQQMQDPSVLAARPYVQLRAVRDSRTTTICTYCDGLTFDRRSDPGWTRFAPPLHFQCRTNTVVLGSADVNRSQVTRSSSVDARGYPQPGFGGTPSLDLDDETE